MSSLVVLPQISPDERALIQFNFLSALSQGQSILSATVTATVWAGTASSPASILSGAPSFSANVVQQAIAGAIAGTIYKLECQAVASDGSEQVQYGYLACVGDPL